jgi:outer membrane biosynthesis protein TonB
VGPGLDEKVIEAVKTWKFQPAMKKVPGNTDIPAL